MWVGGHYSRPFFDTRYFASLEGLEGGLGPRHTPGMDWVPRWFSAYYASDEQFLTYSADGATYDDPTLVYDDPDATYDSPGEQAFSNNYNKLRRWYHLTVIEPLEHQQRFSGPLVPQFHIGVSAPRAAFQGRYDLGPGVIPKVQLEIVVPTQSVVTVRRAATMASLLYEPKDPVWFYDGNRFLLKNLEMVTYEVEAASGYLDLVDAVSGDPMVKDSLIVVANSYGDPQYVDQDDPRWKDNKLRVSNPGVYYVSYLSQGLRDQLKGQTANIIINGEKIRVSPYDLDNVFDEYGRLFGIKRLPEEDNDRLRRRCQYLSLARTFQQRVSAALGACIPLYWRTAGSLSFEGSGVVSVVFPGIAQEIQVFRENPVRDGSLLRLTYPMKGDPTVVYEGRIVDPATYTVSGGNILPAGAPLDTADAHQVEVSYQVQIYSLPKVGGEVVSVVPESLDSRLVMGLATTKIEVIQSIKRNIDWRWNKEHGPLNGLATFE